MITICRYLNQYVINHRLPFPRIPPASDVMSLTFILDSFVLAVLGFCISLSMGKPIAAMFDYELDATTELFSEVKKPFLTRYIILMVIFIYVYFFPS